VRPSILTTPSQRHKQRKGAQALSFVRVYFALFVIGAAFFWSIYSIVTTRAEEAPPGTTTLRIGHWQLETGVRDGLSKLAAEYQKLHPNVRIVQDAIPISVYPTWLTTNLLGGTAPDMVEVPRYHMPDDIILSFHNRYFLPITPYITRPNPYNKGTNLEGVPLRKTFKDGMRNAYVKETQEYMSIPLSLFGARVFYNKDLLKKLTGLNEAPSDYRAFLKVCAQIETQKNEKGQRYAAIAGSRDHLWAWEAMMFDPLTYPAVRRVDFNRDGVVSSHELFVAIKTDRMSLTFPAFKARYQMMREVTNHFQVGYTGVPLGDAIFLFAQQRAVFLSTGTWDARSLQTQANGKFEIGIMDFPRPAPSDPEYGSLMEGPVYEEQEQGFPFAVTRNSKNAEIAVDFLLFLAAQKQNEELNSIMGWIPSIQGAKIDSFLKPFEPHLEGVYTALMLRLGGETRNKYQQVYSLYQSKQIDFDQLVKEFEPFYKTRGEADYLESQRDWRRGILINEQLLAAQRARAMLGTGDEQKLRWIKYRAFTTSRQVLPEVEHSQQLALIRNGPSLKSTGPYEYSAELLDRVRRRIFGAHKEAAAR